MKPKILYEEEAEYFQYNDLQIPEKRIREILEDYHIAG